MESRDVAPGMGRKPNIVLLGKLLLGRVGRGQERALAMSYLLDASELPGSNWTNSRQASLRSVRVPVGHPRTGRYVLASRNYRQGSPTRYVWIEIGLMASEHDADTLIHRSRAGFYRRAGVETLAERDVSGYDLPGVVNAELYERDTKRGSSGGTIRYVSGRVGDVFMHVQAGASSGGWSWEETLGFVTAQVEKIQRLGNSGAAPIV